MTWTPADLERVAYEMHRAARRGSVGGREADYRSRYFKQCGRTEFGTNLFFSRDVGHHTSGWFKNPEFERCMHLSTSAQAPAIWTPDTPDLDKKLLTAWVRAFFHDDVRYVWAESPKSPQGKAVGVLHWRLFCDEHWEPILPRGEVYGLEFTEKGWKSASELGVEIVSLLDPG